MGIILAYVGVSTMILKTGLSQRVIGSSLNLFDLNKFEGWLKARFDIQVDFFIFEAD